MPLTIDVVGGKTHLVQSTPVNRVGRENGA